MKRHLCIFTTILILIFLGLHHFGVALFEYNGKTEGNFKGTIVSVEERKQSKNVYHILIDGNKFICHIYNKSGTKTIEFEVGDIIEFYGRYNKPYGAKNEGGLDYNLYLRTKNIKRIFSADSCKKIGEDKSLNVALIKIFTAIRSSMKECYQQNLKKEYPDLLCGLTIGDKSNIEQEVLEKYRDVSLSHVLAISGAHFAYIILCFEFFNRKLKRKRLGQIITLLGIIFFVELTSATPSVIRAGTMAAMGIIGSLIHRKNDGWTTMCFSILIQFINNPYVIFGIGFQMSYAGVIGIVCFRKLIKKVIRIRVLSECISANIMILPILIYNYQTFSLSFLVSSFRAGVLLGPIVILGFLSVIFRFKIIFWMLNLLLYLFQQNVEICSLLPLARIYVTKPTLISVVTYYIFIFTLDSRKFFKLKTIKHKVIKLILVFVLLSIIFNLNYEVIFANFKDEMLLNFVDVRQGDCCLIRYDGKTIIIDGGGRDDADIGKKTLLPYLLTKKITKIDYMFVSHMDSDHCKGLFYVAENLKVEQIIIGLQAEEYENLKALKEIASTKKIKIVTTQAGDIINISKMQVTVLWPVKELMIDENAINNNSLVFRIDFKNNSFLFTGDIEKPAEEKILSAYKYNRKILDVDVLKIGHHGSKSSSIDGFISATTPTTALIGVSADNIYGHPANSVIERLHKIDCKIYRTDQMGEIKLVFK